MSLRSGGDLGNSYGRLADAKKVIDDAWYNGGTISRGQVSNSTVTQVPFPNQAPQGTGSPVPPVDPSKVRKADANKPSWWANLIGGNLSTTGYW